MRKTSEHVSKALGHITEKLRKGEKLSKKEFEILDHSTKMLNPETPSQGPKPRITKKMIQQAIEGCEGLKKRVYQRLKCSHKTLDKYLKKWPELEDELHAQRRLMLDVAENSLYELMTGYDEKTKLTASIFYLKCHGKARGWRENSDDTGSNQLHLHFDERAKDV